MPVPSTSTVGHLQLRVCHYMARGGKLGWKIGLCCKHIMTISTSIIKRKVNQDIIHTSRGNGQSAKICTEYEMLEDEASIICLLRLDALEN